LEHKPEKRIIPMSNLIDRHGRKVPFLKIAIPCWIDSLFAFGMIGHTLYLEANRPTAPDPAQGFVIAQTVNRTTHYLTRMDQILNAALWVMLFVSTTAVLIYFWRLGILRFRAPGSR
jgi:hypothetical protein